ncbi:MAG: L-rhamnose isomerase [Candidatus Lokiarchaeota archaeon]|nr:L-rhamnose isomerase [Candidatus Lokiarchaeota archaeon]
MLIMNKSEIIQAYESAKKRYAKLNVDTDSILEIMNNISISIHCWQGDDVGGFETPDSELSGGGLQVTGNYLGKARTISELRQDYEKVLSLLPGTHRVNLHAIYGEFGGKKVDRNEIGPSHFQGWIDWAKKNDVSIDFNPTLFSHPKADSGFTLSSKDKHIRDFWIKHVKKCRKIAEYIGKAQKDVCINNLWIPDGTKDIPIDRYGHRRILKESLEDIYSESLDSNAIKDSVEGKLFGIGSESFVVGSYDFYLAYASQHPDIMICLDMGHFHPTENVGEKIPSILQFQDSLLLHVSRGVRWDSDHVVILNDDLLSVAHEVIRADAVKRTYVALDFFDASINRLGAWVIGTRSTLKSFLIALLEPKEKLKKLEEDKKLFERLAYLEHMKQMPFGAVWDYYCLKKGVPVGVDYIDSVLQYEQDILGKRV